MILLHLLYVEDDVVVEFESSIQSIADGDHPERPATIATPEMVNKDQYIMANRRLTELYINYISFQS